MIYVMSDFHLPSKSNKSMDIFGWGDHTEKIREQWPLIDEDTIIIPGDISWALKLNEAVSDIAWLSSLPGKKVIMKGNHDIWWNSSAKIKKILEPYTDISFIYNNSLVIENYSICGTRGWDIISEEEDDIKIREREINRLKLSLNAAEKKDIIAFMHYPPLFKNCSNHEFHDIFLKYGVKQVYYGHLHGDAAEAGFQGEKDGVRYELVAADYLGFKPICIHDTN